MARLRPESAPSSSAPTAQLWHPVRGVFCAVPQPQSRLFHVVSVYALEWKWSVLQPLRVPLQPQEPVFLLHAFEVQVQEFVLLVVPQPQGQEFVLLAVPQGQVLLLHAFEVQEQASVFLAVPQGQVLLLQVFEGQEQVSVFLAVPQVLPQAFAVCGVCSQLQRVVL